MTGLHRVCNEEKDHLLPLLCILVKHLNRELIIKVGYCISKDV